MEQPEPIDPNFRIELPAFEGPLDLLLHLIQKHELSILDLPIAFVTDKYLAYLDVMKKLNLDVAAEYLLMAAKLAHMKSKLLLPKPPEDQDADDLEEGDPREELIRRLLEYQKYKLAAQDLGSRGVVGRDVFTRGGPAPKSEGPAPLAEMGLFKLLDAFQGVLERTSDRQALEVDAERISIRDRIAEIVDRLQGKRTCAFDELFEGMRTTYDVIVTFLAILEMAKMRMMRVYQSDPDAPLHLEYRVIAVDPSEDMDAAHIPASPDITADGPGPAKVRAPAEDDPTP